VGLGVEWLLDSVTLVELITDTIKRQVTEADTVTEYREPLVGFAAAGDPRFADLRRVAAPTHMMPEDVLPDARSVVAFFLPFAADVVEANAQEKERVAHEWSTAYVETNALISRITAHLVELLAERGVRAAAEPPTHNFDPVTLVSRWSHKSVAVIAGLGSFGLHHLLITDAGCAGRFGSLVIDAELPATAAEPRERCLYFHDGSCLECVMRCPVAALGEDNEIDKQACWRRLQEVAGELGGLDGMGLADACGKCSCGPCALESAV
jgi:epoxyqueuosine reductase QueG